MDHYDYFTKGLDRDKSFFIWISIHSLDIIIFF
jgi:hypothetical protein